jgi:hypothetical protein
MQHIIRAAIQLSMLPRYDAKLNKHFRPFHRQGHCVQQSYNNAYVISIAFRASTSGDVRWDSDMAYKYHINSNSTLADPVASNKKYAGGVTSTRAFVRVL